MGFPFANLYKNHGLVNAHLWQNRRFAKPFWLGQATANHLKTIEITNISTIQLTRLQSREKNACLRNPFVHAKP